MANRNYIDAPPEIEKLARKLIKKYRLLDAETAKIKFLFKYTNAQVIDSELGYINKAVGHWKYLTEYDFVVTLWANWWGEAPPKSQEANLLHQLLHIGVNQNNGNFELKKHPIECFPEEIVGYGAWNHSLQELVTLTKKSK